MPEIPAYSIGGQQHHKQWNNTYSQQMQNKISNISNTTSPRPLVSVFIITACVLATMLIFFGPTDNWSWDPSFYYAQLRSPIIENDLDFRNETITGGIETKFTVTGLQHSPWPIGPSILWSPFFLLAHFFVLCINPQQADGFSAPYIALVSLGSAIFGVFGLLVIYRICRYFGSKYLSLLTSILCLCATPLFFYIFRQPIMAHTTALFATAIIVWVYLLLQHNQLSVCKSGLLFGVFLGLNFLTRWSGLLSGIFPLAFFAGYIQKAVKKRDPAAIKAVSQQGLILGCSFLITILPQMALWYRLHNRFLILPQESSVFVESVLPVNTLNVFLHTNRGLLFWAPFVVLGICGIAYVSDLKLKLASIAYILSTILLVGYRADWFSGGGFGARYFIEALPIVAIGFVSLWKGNLDHLPKKALLSACLIAFTAHQFTLLHAVEHAVEPGWVDWEKYWRGKPVGLRFQIESFARLLKSPGLWFLPRPYVAPERQAIVVSYLAGQRSIKVYLVPGIATVLALVLTAATAVSRRRIDESCLTSLSLMIMIYMMLWSLYLLIFVG